MFFSLFFIGFFAFYLFFGIHAVNASGEEIGGSLLIPAAQVNTDVVSLKLGADGLDTPDYLAGSFSIHDNKTLLIGHSTTVFRELDSLKPLDKIYYNSQEYYVSDVSVMKKDDIQMNAVLAEANEPTLVLMTCAGEIYEDGDASHRLIITARLTAF